MYLITLACLQYIKKFNVKKIEYFYQHYVKSELYFPAGNPPCVSRCLDSLQMFCVFSKQISQVGYCQYGSLRVLHGSAGVTRI